MTQLELQNEINIELLNQGINVDEELKPRIALLTFKSNYIQIIYEFSIDVLHVVLKVLEDNEIYGQCAVVKQTIEKYNKLEGKSFATTYKNHE